MVMRKRFSTRKRVSRQYRRPRRVSRRYSTIPRQLISNKTHNFKRKYLLKSIAVAQSAGVGNIGITLNQLPNYAEYQALFDRYKINSVLLEFHPTVTSSDLNASAGINQVSSIFTAIDHNDLTNVANSNVLMEYGQCKRHSLIRPFKQYIRLSTVNPTTSETSWNKWYSTANADITNYGLKYAYSGITAGSFSIDVYATVYLSCKALI